MFESAELGHTVDKAVFRKEVPRLRQALLEAQYALLDAPRFPVVILINGVDGAGKGETVNLLHEWMDPRHIRGVSYGPPSDEERERPPMWRFWRTLPPKGRIGLLFGSWYTQPILDRVAGQTSAAELGQSIDEIVRFERMLCDEGALLLKFWFHLSKKAQRKRLKALQADPEQRWRVTEEDWAHWKLYDKFRRVCEVTLRETSTGESPWLVVEGADHAYRSLTVGKTLLAALRGRLGDKPPKKPHSNGAKLLPSLDARDVLSALDQSASVPKARYDKQLETLQGRLNLLSRSRGFARRAVVCVFEGNDAAGKGGAIRRITAALDARQYEVIPVAAPSEEERAQPYLWRFWRQLPRLGRFSLYDRSWYGRVLVERVEGFCAEADWMRAYSEINDFEQQLARHGIVVAKFWLAVTAEEQLRRFKEREKTGFKRYKITDEDWRNREKWDAYQRAVCDMVDRTSTSYAPWTLVEANDKRHARLKVLGTLCDAIEAAL